MNKVRIPTKRNYKKGPNINSGAEKYNNCIEKFTRGVNNIFEQAEEKKSVNLKITDI